MPDLLSHRETEPAEEPARFNRRKMVRWMTILIIGTAAMVALWADPLYPNVTP
ncbi:MULTISPECIES: hypothetical protein [Actinoplanes]|uniref:hypothetical protein n=1 Tax=Actinoplanes TaxID=1865 RepID=UPI0014701F5C|nr:MULTISPECIES: hypothetical protein [Actinoplanes]GLY06194.1 hypothetical protein Acsp01_65730 [Actinoplanes sp. NBRC 101535]